MSNAELVPWFNGMFMPVPLYKAVAAGLPFQRKSALWCFAGECIGEFAPFCYTF